MKLTFFPRSAVTSSWAKVPQRTAAFPWNKFFLPATEQVATNQVFYKRQETSCHETSFSNCHESSCRKTWFFSRYDMSCRETRFFSCCETSCHKTSAFLPQNESPRNVFFFLLRNELSKNQQKLVVKLAYRSALIYRWEIFSILVKVLLFDRMKSKSQSRRDQFFENIWKFSPRGEPKIQKSEKTLRGTVFFIYEV